MSSTLNEAEQVAAYTSVQAEFRTEMQEAITSILHGRKRPKVLWHYTTADGLQGILRENALHGTDAAYLNDRTEISHAAGIYNAVFEGARGFFESHDPVIVEALQLCKERLRCGRTDDATYVISFSEAEDLITQWGYGTDHGYSFTILVFLTIFFIWWLCGDWINITVLPAWAS